MISRTSTAVALALALAAPLAAQNAATYKRNPGDTLRYHEMTETDVSGGFASGQSHRDATLAITFLGGDNASAWFEAYEEVSKFGGREMTIPAASMVNHPIALQLAADGAVQLSAPPAQGPGGPPPLTRFFAKLPSGPLAVGTEWADTTAARPMGRGPATPELLVVKYKVVKDSAGPAGKVVIIEAKGDVTSKTTASGEAGAQLEVKNTTSEKGRIVFAVDQGRMLSWDRSIERSTRSSNRGGIAGGGRMGPGGAAENNRPPAGTVRGHVDMTAPEGRANESKTRIHTLIQLVSPGEAKAAPAK